MSVNSNALSAGDGGGSASDSSDGSTSSGTVARMQQKLQRVRQQAARAAQTSQSVASGIDTGEPIAGVDGVGDPRTTAGGPQLFEGPGQETPSTDGMGGSTVSSQQTAPGDAARLRSPSGETAGGGGSAVDTGSGTVSGTDGMGGGETTDQQTTPGDAARLRSPSGETVVGGGMTGTGSGTVPDSDDLSGDETSDTGQQDPTQTIDQTEPDRFGDLSPREIGRIIDVSRETPYDPSDLQVVQTDEGRVIQPTQAAQQGVAATQFERAFGTTPAERTRQQVLQAGGTTEQAESAAQNVMFSTDARATLGVDLGPEDVTERTQPVDPAPDERMGAGELDLSNVPEESRADVRSALDQTAGRTGFGAETTQTFALDPSGRQEVRDAETDRFVDVFDSVLPTDIGEGDVTRTDSGLTFSDDAQRDIAAAQIDERTAVDVGPEDVRQTSEGGFSLTSAAEREVVAEQSSEELPIDVGAGDVRRAPDGEYRLTEEAESEFQDVVESTFFRMGEAGAMEDFERDDRRPYSGQRARYALAVDAAQTYSEQLGFDVPASAVDVETETRDGQQMLVPELDTRAAKQAGQTQGDIFSGAVGAVEGVEEGIFGAVGVDQDEVADDLAATTPLPETEPGSVLNPREVEEFAGQNQVTGALEDVTAADVLTGGQGFGDVDVTGPTVGDVQQDLRERGQGFTEAVSGPGGEAIGTALQFNPLGPLQLTAGEAAVDAITGDTESTTAQYADAFATGGLELFNVPAHLSKGITAADVAATGAEQVGEGEGAAFAAGAGAAGLMLGANLTEQAVENPTQTAGMVAGGSVASVATTPFRVATLRVPTDGPATRLPRVSGPNVDATLPRVSTGIRADAPTVEADVSTQRAIHGVAGDSPNVDVAVPDRGGVRVGRPSVDFSQAGVDVEGPSLTRPSQITTRGLRLEVPLAAQALGINARGRTLAGARGFRPTLGAPSLAGQADQLQLTQLGTTGTATAEARSAFEADVFRETATDVSAEAGERFRAAEQVQRQAQLARQPDFTVETAEEAIGQARAVPGARVGEVTEALRDLDATIFGSAAARAQVEDFRQPRDLDIVVDSETEAIPRLYEALEGERPGRITRDVKDRVGEVFDIKETADVPGRAAGGEEIKFGRVSQAPRELGGVPFNPVGEELVRKSGASAFIREPGAAGTPEFDVGPEPRSPRPDRVDVREKDVTDTQMLAQELGISDPALRRFEQAYGLEATVPESGPLFGLGEGVTGQRGRFGFGDRGMAGGGRRPPDDDDISRREFMQRTGSAAVGAGLFSDIDLDIGGLFGGLRRAGGERARGQSMADARIAAERAEAEMFAAGDVTAQTVRQELSMGSMEATMSESAFRGVIQQEIERGAYDPGLIQDAVERGAFGGSGMFDDVFQRGEGRRPTTETGETGDRPTPDTRPGQPQDEPDEPLLEELFGDDGDLMGEQVPTQPRTEQPASPGGRRESFQSGGGFTSPGGTTSPVGGSVGGFGSAADSPESAFGRSPETRVPTVGVAPTTGQPAAGESATEVGTQSPFGARVGDGLFGFDSPAPTPGAVTQPAASPVPAPDPETPPFPSPVPTPDPGPDPQPSPIPSPIPGIPGPGPFPYPSPDPEPGPGPSPGPRPDPNPDPDPRPRPQFDFDFEAEEQTRGFVATADEQQFINPIGTIEDIIGG